MMKRLRDIVLMLLFWAASGDARSVSSKKVPAERKAAQRKTVAEKQEPYKAYIVVEASTGQALEGENIHE